ncbi:MAG: thioredoxin family protein [Thermoguttaceae bacterium]|nr:thioredoxin family protein [Thermoguttaceae bacterium]MDW8078544.1 thioredoxin family protein [Thermoguttaceae bacterium]
MMLIQVLGPGCARCQALANNVAEAVRQLGISAEIEKVTDLNQIISFGVVATPALVVNGELKLSGKVASVDEIKEILFAAK